MAMKSIPDLVFNETKRIIESSNYSKFQITLNIGDRVNVWNKLTKRQETAVICGTLIENQFNTNLQFKVYYITVAGGQRTFGSTSMSDSKRNYYILGKTYHHSHNP